MIHKNPPLYFPTTVEKYKFLNEINNLEKEDVVVELSDGGYLCYKQPQFIGGSSGGNTQYFFQNCYNLTSVDFSGFLDHKEQEKYLKDLLGIDVLDSWQDKNTFPTIDDYIKKFLLLKPHMVQLLCSKNECQDGSRYVIICASINIKFYISEVRFESLDEDTKEEIIKYYKTIHILNEEERLFKTNIEKELEIIDNYITREKEY